MTDSTSERDAYLNHILNQLHALNGELILASPDENGDDYIKRWRAIHRLKEEYKRLTGIYPDVPPYGGARFREPGT